MEFTLGELRDFVEKRGYEVGRVKTSYEPRTGYKETGFKNTFSVVVVLPHTELELAGVAAAKSDHERKCLENRRRVWTLETLESEGRVSLYLKLDSEHSLGEVVADPDTHEGWDAVFTALFGHPYTVRWLEFTDGTPRQTFDKLLVAGCVECKTYGVVERVYSSSDREQKLEVRPRDGRPALKFTVTFLEDNLAAKVQECVDYLKAGQVVTDEEREKELSGADLLNFLNAEATVTDGKVVYLTFRKKVGRGVYEEVEPTTEQWDRLGLEYGSDNLGCLQEHDEGADRGGYVVALDNGCTYSDGDGEWYD